MMPGASEDDAGELPWADAGNLAVNDKIAKHIRRYFLQRGSAYILPLGRIFRR